MSSSTDLPVVRTRLVRSTGVATAPVLQDLDALSPAARQVVDPAALADALARGYEDGRADGYADGLAAGQAAARDDAARQQAEQASRIELALGALATATEHAALRRDEAIAGLEATLVSAAFELTEALLGRELEMATSLGRDALARALRLAEGTEAVVVRLHPDDVATLGDAASLAPGRDLTVVPDPGVERGGCLLQAGDGCVDARLSSALDRVRRVLAP